MSRRLFTSRDGGDLKIIAHREALRVLLSLEDIHFMRQTHSDVVLEVVEGGEDFECDALVTTSKGVGLAALAADCMPITFESPGVVGVAHVGRVGLIKEIAPKTVSKMRELGATEIKATIGPSICARCYEVSFEMYREIIAEIPSTATSDQSHCLDLQSGVTWQLNNLGVSVTNLGICTLEEAGYFSYRGGNLLERQAGIISL
jgi:YfiH family protein